MKCHDIRPAGRIVMRMGTHARYFPDIGEASGTEILRSGNPQLAPPQPECNYADFSKAPWLFKNHLIPERGRMTGVLALPGRGSTAHKVPYLRERFHRLLQQPLPRVQIAQQEMEGGFIGLPSKLLHEVETGIVQ
jgi:hypothetical protein